MKRLISVLLVVSMMSMLAVGLTACGESETESKATESETPSISEINEDEDTETSEGDSTTKDPTDEVTEEPKEETNPEIKNLKATLLEEKASLPDPDGRQIKKASKYRIDGSLASETEYYENGVTADVIEYDMDGNIETETKYNESGEVIEEHDYRFNDHNYDDHNYYEYGEFGIISKTNYRGIVSSESLPSDDDMAVKELYSYNESGNLTRIDYEVNRNLTGTNYSNEEYVYDENNNLLEYYKGNSLAWEFTYDENNNMTSAKIYNSGYVFTPYYIYTYDNDNNLVTEKLYNLDDLSLREWEEYIYDGDDNLIQINYYDNTDNLRSSSEYTDSSEEYEYWDNGNLLLSYRDSYEPNCNYLEKQRQIDDLGNYTVYWDNGNVAIEGTTENDFPTKKYDYFGNVTFELDENTNILNYRDPDTGMLTTMPDTFTYTYTYDESGNILTELFEKGTTVGSAVSERIDYTYENEYYD